MFATAGIVNARLPGSSTTATAAMSVGLCPAEYFSGKVQVYND
jgi:hypothetical protein